MPKRIDTRRRRGDGKQLGGHYGCYPDKGSWSLGLHERPESIDGTGAQVQIRPRAQAPRAVPATLVPQPVPAYTRPPGVIQQFLDTGMEGEAALLQVAMTQLARGEDIVLSSKLELLVIQAQRRCGPFAPPPPRPIWLGLRRSAIG